MWERWSFALMVKSKKKFTILLTWNQSDPSRLAMAITY